MATRRDELLFLDTNILLAATDASRDSHELAFALLDAAGSRGPRCAVSGQVIREYLAVATRPVSANGLGMKIGDALANVAQMETRLEFCEETPAVCELLQRLAQAHQVAGKALHDANIVATMTVHRVECLVTENPAVFEAYEGISLLTLEQTRQLISAG
jgi:predicted nucleic acid-binding protein